MASRKKRPSAADSKKAPAGEKKDRITLYFRRSLLEEARSAVLQLGFQGKQPSTLSTLFDAALERELVRMRKAHNAGEPFEPYKAPLPGGRPRKG
jgi:hypothetical protein